MGYRHTDIIWDKHTDITWDKHTDITWDITDRHTDITWDIVWICVTSLGISYHDYSAHVMYVISHVISYAQFVTRMDCS